MNKINLIELIEEIADDLKKEKPELKACKTTPGKKFQKELNDLMNLMRQGNLFQISLDMISFLLKEINEILSKESIINLDDEILIKPVKENSQIKEFKVKLKDIFNPLKIPKPLQKIANNIPLYLETINSYYILALFAYIDYYCTSVFELLISQNCNKKIEKLLFYLRPKANPNIQINIIKDNLGLINNVDLKKLLKGKTWQKSFEKLITLRNILAHEEPKVKKQVLSENFPSLYKIAQKKANDEFNKQTEDNPKLNQEELEKLQKVTKPNFEMMLLLTDIGKECYGYLALIDILIDYFPNKY